LDKLVRQARPVNEASALFQQPATRSMSPAHALPQEDPPPETDVRVRSQAEKELLRALRMTR
jgi:hypothetical protein